MLKRDKLLKSIIYDELNSNFSFWILLDKDGFLKRTYKKIILVITQYKEN